MERLQVGELANCIYFAFFQVSEQIGELYIHCKYGCKLKSTGSPTDYEVNPSGCPVTVKLSNRQ